MTDSLELRVNMARAKMQEIQASPPLTRMARAGEFAEDMFDLLDEIAREIRETQEAMDTLASACAETAVLAVTVNERAREQITAIWHRLERITPYHDETAGLGPVSLPAPANDDGGEDGISTSVG